MGRADDDAGRALARAEEGKGATAQDTEGERGSGARRRVARTFWFNKKIIRHSKRHLPSREPESNGGAMRVCLRHGGSGQQTGLRHARFVRMLMPEDNFITAAATPFGSHELETWMVDGRW